MNLLIRILSSSGAIGLIGCVLWQLPKAFFSIGTSVFCGIAMFEILTMLKGKGVQVYRLFGVAMGAMLPLVVHLQYGISHSGEVLFIVLSCFCLFLIQFSRKNNPNAIEGIALTFFAIMYVAWFLSFIVKLNFLANGALWITYLLVVTKACDVAAFGFGSVFGKTSLIPHISPNKSVEGTMAGVICSALVSALFQCILPVHIGVLHLLSLGLVIGLVAQCGDLSESLIKRYCGVKDSSEIIPGFGGLLDVIDSALFTIPLFYYYLETWH
ncbi:MAG: phosphatidate cytidylyltransferase [Candidatus Omnitrophota bacterium]|jgi:phosphatidate cytidylyltransferase